MSPSDNHDKLASQEQQPEPYAIGYDDVVAAAATIRGKAMRTPVLTCETLSSWVPADPVSGDARTLFFKCENFQKIGAFKFRGAFNAIASLPEDVRKNGIVTHSSGNHAQAIALAARMHSVPAYIVMPTTAPLPKLQAVRDYGAEVHPCEPTLASRESTAAEVLKAHPGATLIHPFNNPKVMAGQGTLMLEFIEQVEQMTDGDDEGLDAVIVPAGGCGMLSGCATVAAAARAGGRGRKVRVFGCEPVEVNDVWRAFHEKGGVKERVTAHAEGKGKSIADGLLTFTGPLTWPIVRDLVEDVFTVTEEEIALAMKHVFERMKIVIEPSAAVGVAVVLYNKEFKKLSGIKNVGIVICGGNLDLDKPLPWQLPQQQQNTV
ncbi:serine racemase [Zopfochytrium polystomum]|nr:serine racemase [Zopfochytrium polystomum]